MPLPRVFGMRTGNHGDIEFTGSTISRYRPGTARPIEMSEIVRPSVLTRYSIDPRKTLSTSVDYPEHQFIRDNAILVTPDGEQIEPTSRVMSALGG